MYIDSHTKSHNFLKISMFSNKKFTFSSSAQLFEKLTFLTKFNFFFSKIDIFAQKLMLRKTLVTLLQSLHDMILSLYLKIHSFGQKTNTFCIKWHFLPKGNNATKNWHFSKTENTSVRKLTMSTRNYNFWKEWPFARKMKISFNIGVSARLYHNETIDTKPIVICWKNENILQYWCFCKISAYTSETQITKKLK